MLPPTRASRPARASMWPIRARGRRLAVGAGDRHHPGPPVVRRGGDRPGEQFDVADDLDAGVARPLDRPVRRRMGQRARRARGPAPRSPTSRRWRDRPVRSPRRRRLRAPRRSRPRRRPARRPRASARAAARPERARPNTATVAALEDVDRDHARAIPYRSFRVARPSMASMMATIQKRITTVGSDQPRRSKWWWIGAIRKTRRPVRLNHSTWMITETVSTTNRPPTIPRTISCLVATATAPSAPPRARAPRSRP